MPKDCHMNQINSFRATDSRLSGITFIHLSTLKAQYSSASVKCFKIIVAYIAVHVISIFFHAEQLLKWVPLSSAEIQSALLLSVMRNRRGRNCCSRAVVRLNTDAPQWCWWRNREHTVLLLFKMHTQPGISECCAKKNRILFSEWISGEVGQRLTCLWGRENITPKKEISWSELWLERSDRSKSAVTPGIWSECPARNLIRVSCLE